jgi:hypothetical protein
LALEERSWNWIEKTSKKHQRQHYIASLILIFYLIILIYLIIINNVKCAQLNFFSYITILDMFILILFLFVGVQYFTYTMRETFRNLEINSEYKGIMIELYSKMEKNFTKSKTYYLLVFVILISYIFIPPPEKSDFFYFHEPTVWSASIDIIDLAATLLVLYLMATILWIIFNISWVLDEIGQESNRGAIKIELYSSDKVGGMKSLANLVLHMSIYQFIAISLAIISFVSPEDSYYKEIIFFASLFIISTYFFFNGGYVLNKLLEVKRAEEINLINQQYHKINKLLIDIISNKDIANKMEMLDQISKSKELLRAERETLLTASKITFNIKENFVFFTSSLLPFIVAYILPFFKN